MDPLTKRQSLLCHYSIIKYTLFPLHIHYTYKQHIVLQLLSFSGVSIIPLPLIVDDSRLPSCAYCDHISHASHAHILFKRHAFHTHTAHTPHTILAHSADSSFVAFTDPIGSLQRPHINFINTVSRCYSTISKPYPIPSTHTLHTLYTHILHIRGNEWNTLFSCAL